MTDYAFEPVGYDPFAGFPASGSMEPTPSSDTFADRFNAAAPGLPSYRPSDRYLNDAIDRTYPELPTTYRPPERWNQGDVRLADASGGAPVMAYGDEPSAAPAPAAASPPVDLTAAGLTQARSVFSGQLGDPGMRRLLAASVRAEVGGQGPEAEQAYIESVFNRAAARGMTLQQALISDARSGGYYPATTINKLGAAISPDEQARIDAHVGKVLAGSNLANFATGNASHGVGFAGGPKTYDPRTGEYFGIEGPDREWARAIGAGETPQVKYADLRDNAVAASRQAQPASFAELDSGSGVIRHGNVALVPVAHDPFATQFPSAAGGGGWSLPKFASAQVNGPWSQYVTVGAPA